MVRNVLAREVYQRKVDTLVDNDAKVPALEWNYVTSNAVTYAPAPRGAQSFNMAALTTTAGPSTS